MDVLAQGHKRRMSLSVQPLRVLAPKILQRLGQPEVEVGLVFVSDRQIRRLNKKYRGIDSPTDVLAFALSLDPKAIKGTGTENRTLPLSSIRGKGRTPPPLLGDVVISLQTARRQALEKHHALYQEVGLLLIHGILHLLGFDHEEARDARRMRRKEREFAKELLKTE